MYNKPDQRSGKTHRHLFNGSLLRVSWVHRSYTPQTLCLSVFPNFCIIIFHSKQLFFKTIAGHNLSHLPAHKTYYRISLTCSYFRISFCRYWGSFWCH